MDQLYQHYRLEEAAIVDKMLDSLNQVDQNYAPSLMDFLSPRERMILQELDGRYPDLHVQCFGGYEGAERQRALVYPDYFQPTTSDFQIEVLNVTYPSKFATLTHGRILGTLMSTGIERYKVGDIISDGQAWQIICDKQMASYFMTHVTKIGNVGVRLTPIDLNQMVASDETWELSHVVVSSTRLDTVIGKVYNFSRQRAKNMIQSGYVKVNFREEDRTDLVLEIQDLISVRQHGRFRIESMDGVTKKDNIRLSVSKLIH